MKNAKRTIGIGVVVWLLFFGWWFQGYLYINWRFKLFSLDSWRFLVNEIRQGWRISTLTDWIFLISFILSGPLFCWLWYLAIHIHWRRTFKKIYRGLKKGPKFIFKKICSLFKKQPVLYPVCKPAVEAKGEKKLVRPAKLASYSAGARAPIKTQQPLSPAFSMPATSMNWQTPASEPAKSTPSSFAFESEKPFNPTGSDFREIAETPLSEVELPQIESVNENIQELMQKSGFQIFSSVQFNEKKLDWVGVAQNKIWFACYDDETGDWLADEEAFNDEDPLWFSETDHRVSPVFSLLQLKKVMLSKISALGSEIVVQPVLIERRGNLINAEDMLKPWNDLGVIVCRTDVGGPVELSTVSEVLKDKQSEATPDFVDQVKNLLNLGEITNG